MADPENPFEPSAGTEAQQPSDNTPEEPAAGGQQTSQPVEQPEAEPAQQNPFERLSKKPRANIKMPNMPKMPKMPNMPALPHLPSPRVIGSAVVIIVILALILTIGPGLLKQTNSTSTTTVQANLSKINSCRVISIPGTYYLAGDMNVTIESGACIEIKADHVLFSGNGHGIAGNGPYTGAPPFSYGVEVEGMNDSVTDLTISQFSYDIFLNNSKNATVSLNNLEAATLSDLYMLNASASTIEENQVLGSQSSQGGIYLKSGSGNRFINNTLANNIYYGIVVNSTGNSFTHNIFSNNPADLECNEEAAQSSANLFSGSTCSVNDYCAFASCRVNIPLNFSSTSLSPGSVYSCGAIYTPGNYTLAQSISTSAYVNPTNPLAKGVSCIQILAPNVNFNCNNKQISNSGYGIYLKGAVNANITNCILSNDNYGIAASDSFNPEISGVLARNNFYGMLLSNTTSGKISDSNFAGNNTYGIYLNSSNGVLFDNVVASNNTYGVYVYSGGDNVFSGGRALNNTNLDVYCSASTYNSSTNLASGFPCGVTDCNWASSLCKQTVQPELYVHPLNSCKRITAPGNYSLVQNTIAMGTCFGIQASNVILNCKSNLISGSGSGSAFLISNATNVSVRNCEALHFNTGVNVSNSKQVNIYSIGINATSQGLSFLNVSNSSVQNMRVGEPTINGYTFNALRSSSIINNSVSLGFGNASGFIFTRALNNQITFNNANRDPNYGFEFIDSLNNSVLNNTADSNAAADYACVGSSTGLYSNPVGANFGLRKSSCKWLVAVSSVSSSPACAALFSPDQFLLSSDIVYTTGSTCFSIFTTKSSSANFSSLNCQGHIIYAPKGGTFISVHNSSGVQISNCIFWNFTTAIQSTGSAMNVFNNTFSHNGDAILLNFGRFDNIYKNSVNNNTNGLLMNNVSQISVYDNRFYNNTFAIAFSNSSSDKITNNTALRSSVGIYLSNTILSTLANNKLTDSTISGMRCAGTSGSTISNNLDEGGNVCSSNSHCAWVTHSAQCAPS